jgi:hypothetical protein
MHGSTLKFRFKSISELEFFVFDQSTNAVENANFQLNNQNFNVISK